MAHEGILSLVGRKVVAAVLEDEVADEGDQRENERTERVQPEGQAEPGTRRRSVRGIRQAGSKRTKQRERTRRSRDGQRAAAVATERCDRGQGECQAGKARQESEDRSVDGGLSGKCRVDAGNLRGMP